MSDEVRTTPIDEKSREELAAQGLRFDLLPRDHDAFDHWLQAVGRGFHGPIIAEENLPMRRDGFAPRRLCGIWDDSIDDSASPIATASSWIMDLTVPGRRTLPTWAISTISVAPTHRRRGIARHLMESELRTAVRLGVPAAILTASEATIYSRFGFEPASLRADWTVRIHDTRWIGPQPDGRLQIVTTEQARDDGGVFDLVESARLGVPGEVHFEGMLWTRMFGAPGLGKAEEIRVVRYDDASGVPRGFAIYSADRDDSEHALVRYLVATTDDAYAALWRYMFELDLVSEVRANLRSVSEPFRWQLSNFRAAAENDVHDHLWLRILDVTATLEARQYSADGAFVLEVTDDLGFADGEYLLAINEAGAASVRKLDDVAGGADGFADNHRLALSIGDLAAVYLGATTFDTLVRSGRITEKTPAAAVAADAAFRSDVAPWTSIWF